MQWQTKQLNQYTVEWTGPSASIWWLWQRGHRSGGRSGWASIRLNRRATSLPPEGTEKPVVFERRAGPTLPLSRLLT
jgi:hypothetical protein